MDVWKDEIIVFEVFVNFAFKELFNAFIAVQQSERSVAHICLKAGKNAIISLHPLHPYPNHYQTNADEAERAIFFSPLALSARTMDVPS